MEIEIMPIRKANVKIENNKVVFSHKPSKEDSTF